MLPPLQAGPAFTGHAVSHALYTAEPPTNVMSKAGVQAAMMKRLAAGFASELQASLAPASKFRKAITNRLRKLADSGCVVEGPPGVFNPGELDAETVGPWLYYSSGSLGPDSNGNSTVKHCRRPVAGQSGKGVQVVLDPAAMAAEYGYIHVIQGAVSPNHQYFAMVVDTDGSEATIGLIKDIGTGKLFRLPAAKRLAWSGLTDPSTGAPVLYYTTPDSPHHPSTVHRHVVGRSASHDEKLFEETDAAWLVDVVSSKDHALATVNINSKSTSEVHFIEASGIRLMQARMHGTQYFVEHNAGRLFIVTNHGGHDYKIMTTELQNCGVDTWQTIVGPPAHGHLLDLDMFQHHFAVYEVQQLGPSARVFPVPRHASDLGSVESRGIDIRSLLPAESNVCSIRPASNSDFYAKCLQFNIETSTAPSSMYRYSFADQSLQCVQTSRYQGFDNSVLRSTRIAVRSQDGQDIPVTIVAHKNAAKDGSAPCLLHVYGAYGVTLDTAFDVEWIPFLERGWVLAFAGVRGGGEKGRQWYHDGRQFKKHNTFEDFAAVAKHLIATGVCAPDRLAAKAESAGGLVLGVMANQYPELFRALIMKVPFLNLLEDMQDPSLPLTAAEYEEWGNPADPAVEKYLRSFDPISNVAPHSYPAMLLTGGMNDSRVPVHQPIRFAEKVKKLQTNKRNLVLVQLSEQGHFDNQTTMPEGVATELAFLHTALKLPMS